MHDSAAYMVFMVNIFEHGFYVFYSTEKRETANAVFRKVVNI